MMAAASPDGVREGRHTATSWSAIFQSLAETMGESSSRSFAAAPQDSGQLAPMIRILVIGEQMDRHLLQQSRIDAELPQPADENLDLLCWSGHLGPSGPSTT